MVLNNPNKTRQASGMNPASLPPPPNPQKKGEKRGGSTVLGPLGHFDAGHRRLPPRFSPGLAAGFRRSLKRPPPRDLRGKAPQSLGKGLEGTIGVLMQTLDHSREASMSILSILLSRKPSKTQGNSWLLKRRVVENSGESTPSG